MRIIKPYRGTFDTSTRWYEGLVVSRSRLFEECGKEPSSHSNQILHMLQDHGDRVQIGQDSDQRNREQ